MPPDLAAIPIGRAGELALDFAPAQITREFLGLAAPDPLDSEQPDDLALKAHGDGVNYLRNAPELYFGCVRGGPTAVRRLLGPGARFLRFNRRIAAGRLARSELRPHPGVRPFRWTASCCGFDQALGVLILEVDGAAVAEG